MNIETDYEQASARATRLSFLLDKSQIYAKIIGDRMARQQIEKRKAEKRAETRKANKEKEQKGEAAASGRGGTRGKKAVVKEEEEDTSTGKRRRKSDAKGANKKAKVEETDEEVRPSLKVVSHVVRQMLTHLRNLSKTKPSLQRTGPSSKTTRRSMAMSSLKEQMETPKKTMANTPLLSQPWSPVLNCEITSWQVYNG